MEATVNLIMIPIPKRLEKLLKVFLHKSNLAKHIGNWYNTHEAKK